MKKLFTLCTAFMLGIGAFAQEEVDETFQFVDANGNVVANGTTIVINQINDEGQMAIPLSVRNVSGEKAAVSMFETIDALPNGIWQTCAFGNCMMLTETGYSPKNVMAADYEGSIQTEWIPEEGQFAIWEATLQIHVFNIIKQSRFGVVTEVAGNEIIGYGPKVTIRFEYKDAVDTVVGDVNGDDAVNVADISAVITVMAESEYSKVADVNGDGAVNVADISAVISIMAGE